MSKLKFIIISRNLANFSLRQDKHLAIPASSASRCYSDWVPKEKVTHTGQQWSEDDYRLVRFVDRPKHVNPNWAINLVAEVPPKACKSRVVWCDGGGGPTGHPKVYINLDKPGDHSCGYCGLRFFMDHHAH